MSYVLVGINIGTSKIVAASAHAGGQRSTVAEVLLGQQTASAWLASLREALSQIGAPTQRALIAVCGTAGSFVLTDVMGAVLGRPVMYNDDAPAAVTLAKERLAGTRWADSEVVASDSPVAKLCLALKQLTDEERSRLRWVIPQSVWLSYSLALPSGTPWLTVSADSTNCRKLGGQLRQPQWPVELCERLEIPMHILPTIVPAGTVMGPAQGETAGAWGVQEGTVFHGTTDGTAEAMALAGDTVGEIGMMAGSTTSIKAVVPREIDVSPHAYLADHPASDDNAFYTAWFSVGENVRQRASLEGLTPVELVNAAWRVNEDDIPTIPLNRLPITDAWLDTPAALFARGVIESAAWWEASHLKHIERASKVPTPEIHMIGGTTRDRRWLQLRSDAYQRPIQVYGAAGALGAILPGALKSGVMSSPQEFLDQHRVALQRVAPLRSSAAAAERRHRAQAWLMSDS